VPEQASGRLERPVEVALQDRRENAGSDFARTRRRLQIGLQKPVELAQVFGLARREQKRALQGEIDAAGRRDRLIRGQNVFRTQDWIGRPPAGPMR
jgi:hypothetical protein